MRMIVGLAAFISALAIVMVGCSGSGGLPQAPASAGEQNPWQKTALWVEQGGRTQPFENGRAVAVADVNVELFVAPFPPLREGSIDLYVTDQSTGAPVEAGGLQISFDMYMPHGRISAEALPTGGGHYLVPYKLVMPGEWRVDLTIARSREVAALAFIFKVD